MKRPKEIEWLFRQLPDWVEEGLLTSGQAEALRERYAGAHRGPDLPVAGLIAGILGALLIGGGIILIVAYNWDELSRTWRTVVSFAPLLLGQLLYGYAFFRRRRSDAWAESSATFLMLTLASCLALVSQTYHIEGRPEDFLWIWLWLSLPLLYLRLASLPAVLFLAGGCAWALQAPAATGHWYYLLLMGVIPHLYLGMRPAAPALRRQSLGWTAGLVAFPVWLAVAPAQLPEYSLLGSGLIAALLYLGGRTVFPEGLPFWKRPWVVLSLAAAFTLLLIATYDLGLPAFDPAFLIHGGIRYPQGTAWVHFGVLLLLGAGYLFLLYYSRRALSGPGWILVLLPVFLLLYLSVERTAGAFPAMVLANLYLLAWGAFHLHRGIQQRKPGSVNLGMFLILVLATARFFDTEWSALGKGIAFVLLGVSFLGARYWLGRVLENKKNGPDEAA